MNARVRRKVERPHPTGVQDARRRRPRALPAARPAGSTPDCRPPRARRGAGPQAARVDPEPAPEEEESQEISIVGVRTAEERDAEAFANAIVIEETQPEPAADEDDSQVMDLTLSQPDSAPPPAGDA